MYVNPLSGPGGDEQAGHDAAKPAWLVLLILFFLSLCAILQIFGARILAWALPHLPNEYNKSPAFYSDLLNLISSELLWWCFFLLLAWILATHGAVLKSLDVISLRLTKVSRRFVVSVVALSFTASLVVACFVLERFPNSSDEYVYLYQARTFAEGKLWHKAHDLPDFFHNNHIAQKDGKRVGRFPPGWPAILSSAFALEISPVWVNPILGMLALLIFYRMAVDLYGQRVALWSLPAMALTSFYVFNAASYFSHTSCLLATLLFVYGVYRYRETQSSRFLLLAGFFLGVMITIRYYTALIVFLPFACFMLSQYRFRVIQRFFWIGLGALPCVVLGIVYNYSITGDPWLPVTLWAYADEALGFVRGHTPAKGMEHIVRWMLMFIYWCSPALLILYFTGLWQKLRRRAERLTHPEDYLFVLLIGGYFFYYQIGGNQYGPRFFLEAFPFVILFVVNRVVQSREKWAMVLLAAGMIYAVVKLPFIGSREHRIVVERKDLYRAVKENKLTKAVVFVSSYTGVIRPMPTGDLTRNDEDFRNDVLYALDLKEKNDIIMRYYPDRTFYRYTKKEGRVEGELTLLRQPVIVHPESVLEK